MKLLRFLLPILTFFMVSLSLATAGTIGIEQWDSSTPGGNEIGSCDRCPGKGISIFKGDQAYVEEIREFGFYDQAIIGRTVQGYFAFDEPTQQVIEFENRQQLCSQIKAANRQWNNTLRYFNSSQPIDYYAIKYSLYVFFPFVLLLSLFSVRSIPNLLSEKQVDGILQSKRFALILLVSSAFSKYIMTDSLVKATYPLDELEDLFLEFLYLIIFLIVWIISVCYFPKIHLKTWDYSWLKTMIKLCLYVGILMLGLSLTVGWIQSPDTSIQFFSCDPQ